VSTAANVDEYIAAFPPDVREHLTAVRMAIHAGLDGDAGHVAEEKISYGIAAIEVRAPHAMFFAGWKKHVGLYPVGRLDDDLEQRVAPYRAGVDSVHFRYTDGMPLALITEIAATMAARHPH
jgi:uncharacterized protein YdhG (YjbR/CyaY superfamily)